MNFFGFLEENFVKDNNFSEIPLEVRIDQKEEQEHRLNVTILFGYVCLMILTVLTIWLFHNHRIPFLHESGLVLIYGLIVGIILRFGVNIDPFSTINVIPSNEENVTSIIENLSKRGPPDVMLMDISQLSNDSDYNVYNRTLAYKYQGGILDINNDVRTKTEFDAEIFFNILLPPIIFNAGYSMKRRFFFRNIGSIFAFAFVGTTISTFSVAGVLYLVMFLFPYLQKTMSILDLIRFGALISATDPVTTLSIFNDLNVEVNLYALVFGESVLNDAVAIVITRTLEDYEMNQLENGQNGFGITAMFGSILQFLYVFGVSFIVGSIIACFNALITKFSRIRDLPELESTLLILMSYNAYLLAEMLHLSGIVAILFCGICQAHYTFNNLSEESKGITRQFSSVLNFICENFIFLYVGVSMFVCRTHNYNLPFVIGSFIAIIVGRAANIYPLSFLLNRIRRTKIPWNSQHMLFLSGLRGAIAFGLSVNLTLTPSRNIIRTTTQIIILVTVIISGGSTTNVLLWLKIPVGTFYCNVNLIIANSRYIMSLKHAII